jgi:hypothetical protein
MCLVCEEASEVGCLCRACAQRVQLPPEVIREHLWSNEGAAEASLIDSFGHAHALGARTVVGRDHTDGVVILAKSVSRNHAELKKAGAGWTLRDLGSTNGTFIDGIRIQGRVTLNGPTIIRLGDVALWFMPQAVTSAPDTLATQELGSGMVSLTLTPSWITLRVVGNNDPGSGGTLLAQTPGQTEWVNHKLSPIEFQLMRIVCLRAIAEASSPAEARGCVPTRQLVRDLPWQAQFPDEENVRQVVRRLRSVLAEAGAEGILMVEHGRGYYFACPVVNG